MKGITLSVASFLEENELHDAYISAKDSAARWFEPFDEFERIAANLPSEALPAAYAQVTDGTLSALMSETPMRTWGQLQTGRVVALNNPLDRFEAYNTELTNIVWVNKIIPNANFKAPFFAKHQIAQHKSLIYGCQPAFSFMVNTPYYVGSDFDLPYIKNVKLEPGKSSDTDSDYIWLDRHYTKLQLKGIIEFSKKIKGNSGWDIKALQEIYDSNAFDKQSEDTVSQQAQKAIDYSKVVTLSTCYHRGFKAPFYTIYRGKGTDDNRVVRRDENRNITGDVPINFIYNQRNLINPYGVGQVELAGPTQNLVDFFVAAHATATQRGIDPPIKVSGDPDETGMDIDTIIFESGAQWEVGNGDATVVNMANNIYNQFASTLGMYKTQIMNQQGTSDATVSAGDSGDSRYSKTPAGVKYQQERTNAKDNYLRQRADEFVAGLAKNLINLCIQNMSGDEAIEITEEQRNKLIAAGKDVPEGARSIIINFDNLKKGEFKFDVDANSSIVKNDDETKDRLVEVTKLMLEVPNLDQVLAQENKEAHVGELLQGIIATAGIDDYEKVITPLSDEKRQQLAQMSAIQTAKTQTGAQPTQLAGSDSDDVALAQALMQRGWSQENINEYFRRMEAMRESQEGAAV